MSVEMTLETWKWRLPWPLCISGMSAGNDFQQPRGNQGMRHFQMSSTSAPTGDDRVGRRRPIQAVGALSRWWQLDLCSRELAYRRTRGDLGGDLLI